MCLEQKQTNSQTVNLVGSSLRSRTNWALENTSHPEEIVQYTISLTPDSCPSHVNYQLADHNRTRAIQCSSTIPRVRRTNYPAIYPWANSVIRSPPRRQVYNYVSAYGVRSPTTHAWRFHHHGARGNQKSKRARKCDTQAMEGEEGWVNWTWWQPAARTLNNGIRAAEYRRHHYSVE